MYRSKSFPSKTSFHRNNLLAWFSPIKSFNPSFGFWLRDGILPAKFEKKLK